MKRKVKMVEQKGIEPSTSALRTRRAIRQQRRAASKKTANSIDLSQSVPFAASLETWRF
jgi:hypothetical protein